MKIYSTTTEDIRKALARVNKRFDDNICFKSGPTFFNRTGTSFNVTLTVLDSGGPGSRRGFQRRKDGKRRRLSAACWHVHGYFMYYLNRHAEIVSLGHRITPASQWRDWNAGSVFDPILMSELCDCDC